MDLPRLSYPGAHSQTNGRTREKSQDQQRVSVVGQAQAKARTQSVVRRVFLIGGTVLVILFGMMALLLSYLCLAHKCARGPGGVLISTAPLGKVLTISQVASHVAPTAVPLVMSLWAYHLGAQWLQSSARLETNRPSPLQSRLGLLISICSGANLSSLIQTLGYIFKLGKVTRNQALPTPPLLRRSSLLLFSILLLSYLASGADAWFHASSEAIAINTSSSYDLNQPRNFGREINATMCDPTSYQDGSIAQQTCGLLDGGTISGLQSRPEGLRTISNSSRTNRVVFTDDQTAILVPQGLPPNITFKAETVGLKVVCRSITRQCLSPVGTFYGPMASLTLNCKGDPAFNTTYNPGPPQGPLDQQGNLQGTSSGVVSNPFHFGAVVASQAYEVSPDSFIDSLHNSGWFVHGSNGAYDVLYCDIAALEVVYEYKSSQYVLHTSSPVSLFFARAMLAFGFDTTMVTGIVEGSGIPGQTNVTYEEAFALELERRALAAGALYSPKNATTVAKELTIIGSRVEIVTLALLLGTMLAYSCTVMFVLVQATIAASRVPYVPLAALHITDPLVTVHALYGPFDPVATWSGRAMEMFPLEDERDQLTIGPLWTSATEAETAVEMDASRECTFGVTRMASQDAVNTPS